MLHSYVENSKTVFKKKKKEGSVILCFTFFKNRLKNSVGMCIEILQPTAWLFSTWRNPDLKAQVNLQN